MVLHGLLYYYIVYYRINTSLYKPISLHAIEYTNNNITVDLPATNEGTTSLLFNTDDVIIDSNNDIINPLSKGLITLSTLPRVHWVNLHNLDIIKVCPCVCVYKLLK